MLENQVPGGAADGQHRHSLLQRSPVDAASNGVQRDQPIAEATAEGSYSSQRPLHEGLSLQGPRGSHQEAPEAHREAFCAATSIRVDLGEIGGRSGGVWRCLTLPRLAHRSQHEFPAATARTHRSKLPNVRLSVHRRDRLQNVRLSTAGRRQSGSLRLATFVSFHSAAERRPEESLGSVREPRDGRRAFRNFSKVLLGVGRIWPGIGHLGWRAVRVEL